jgi:uncharacterized protein
MADFKTPGVYIVEKNAFPGSVVAVETAIPVFIGYSEKAERNGKSLIGKPTRITSLAEYHEMFGYGFQSKFTITSAGNMVMKEEALNLNGQQMLVTVKPNHIAYFYNCIRLFYANGGGSCYICSVATYEDKPDGFEIKASDFIKDTTENSLDIFDDILAKEYEPTMVVIPDIIALGKDAYPIYKKVLSHCADMQSRIGIFDLKKQGVSDKTDDVVHEFRTEIGDTNLNYGTAYYPWLKTTVVQADEVSFENLDKSVDLKSLLAEEKAKELLTNFSANANPSKDDKEFFHQSLKAISPSYNQILEAIRSKLNELPASAAMAGIYTMVDNSRGVWKAPANVSVNMVVAPCTTISSKEQESLNVDFIAGKSINAIRLFPGQGVLVWGARTLDGNSQDWRYINVRRTVIMIEQSLKLAMKAYVFEPNDEGTWITVKSMMTNFLTNLWKQGALAGATPEDAFDVLIGLGTTMTPNDILDGTMRVTIKLAIVRPAEFIVITFQQQQQQS